MKKLPKPSDFYLVAKLSKVFWKQLPYLMDAHRFAAAYSTDNCNNTAREPTELERYVDAHREGAGIWKWRHYFDIYERHFAKFVGKPCHVAEIGIYSGGSLAMWRDYFGPQAKLYGIDIEPACKAYETNNTRVFIGDQASREFWKEFSSAVPVLDILIDDGGHTPLQQLVTLEEMLPGLAPGGVYICEDVHGANNYFSAFCRSLADGLNTAKWTASDLSGAEIKTAATDFQGWIHSIHFYPFVTVIEKRQHKETELLAQKRGTVWQPFYNKPGG